MSSRLCKNCKSIHPKPWDNNCKAQVNKEGQSTAGKNMAEADTGAQGGEVQGNDSQLDPGMEIYAELLASVKTLSSQFATFDARLTELTKKIDGKSSTDKPKSQKPASDRGRGHDVQHTMN